MEEKVIVFKMSKIKSKKTEIRELDEVWKKKVKDRDEWTCQICKKKVEKHNAHAHHILPKQIHGMRWDVDNGITLCYNHHKVGNYSAHMNAIWFTYWLKTHKSKQFRYIINKLIRLKIK